MKTLLNRNRTDPLAATTADTRADEPYGRLARIATIQASVAGYAGLLFLPIWVHQILVDYQVAAATAGFIAAGEFSSVAIASIATSLLLRHLKLKPALLTGLSLIIAGNVLPTIAPQLAALIAGRAISGLGAGMVLAMTHALAARFRQPEPIFSSIFFWVILVGALFYPFAPQLASEFGAFVVFYMIAGLTAVAGLAALTPGLPSRFAAPSFPGQATSISRQAKLAITATLVFYIAEGALWTYVISMGVAAGVSTETVGFAVAATIVLGLLGPLAAGWISNRIGGTPPLLLSLIILAATAVILGSATGLLAYIVGLSLLNLVFVFVLIFSSSRLAHLDPSGRCAGFIPALRSIGNAAGPWLGGFILQWHGFPAVGLVVAALYLVSAAMYWRGNSI